MAKYKFQFKTGNVCDGPIEMKVKSFIGEIADEKVNKSLALTIEAHGGQLVPEEKSAKPKTKKREANSARAEKVGEK